jgi:hypothetical protein
MRGLPSRNLWKLMGKRTRSVTVSVSPDWREILMKTPIGSTRSEYECGPPKSGSRTGNTCIRPHTTSRSARGRDPRSEPATRGFGPGWSARPEFCAKGVSIAGKAKSIHKPTIGDAAHALAKGVISAVPIAGSIGAEFFSLVISPPMEKRRAA